MAGISIRGLSKRFGAGEADVAAGDDLELDIKDNSFVTLPLIMPAFFAGLGVVFIRSMTAISATIFLVSISWTLITVRILENMTEVALGPAAAFSVFVIVVVFAVLAAIRLALSRVRTPGGATVDNMLGG